MGLAEKKDNFQDPSGLEIPTGPYTITIDDDPMVAKLISKMTGMPSIAVSSLDQLSSQIDLVKPQVAFIDIHLGWSETGLEILPELRSKWPTCAFIVITGDTRTEAISEALATGADDFIRKPIDQNELTARVQVRLGEKKQLALKSVIEIGDLTVNTLTRNIDGDGRTQGISPSVLSMLLCLNKLVNLPVTRDQIKREIWGNIKVSENALDRKASELRKILKDLSQCVSLQTKYGEGFVLNINQSK